MQNPIGSKLPLKLNWKQMLVWMLLPVLLASFQFTAHAAKILYVQDFSRRDTVKLINILKAQGHDLTVWTVGANGNALTAQQYADQGYQLLLVDEVITSGAVGASFMNSPIPVINWEGFLYSDGRGTFNVGTGTVGGTFATAVDAAAANSGAGADYGQVDNETNINVLLPGHPLAAGMTSGLNAIWDPNPPTVVDEGTGVITFLGTRTLISGASVVATVPGFAGGGCIVGIDAGVLNYDGVTTNQARWVHLPWNDTDEAERVMIEPSFFIFEAAVAWALNLPQPTKIRNFLPVSAAFQSTNLVVSFSVDKVNNAGSSVLTSAIQLRINGSNAISGAVITDGGTKWNVNYTNALQPNKSYTIVGSATSLDGGFSARQALIDTFSSTNFTFEAEDFNFGGGLFFTNIILCTNIGGTTPDCYFDRIGITNIDQNEVNFTVQAGFNGVYRFGDAFDSTRDEFVDTFTSADTLVRPQYVLAGIPEYEVRSITNNEWLNYTRYYPTGTFAIYARVASGSPMTIQMDLVGGDPTTTNQTPLTKLGRFVKPSGTSGYEMVPLSDDTGATPLAIQFTNTGPTTIRVTALSGGYTPNFYMFVPTTAVPNQAPTVTITSPAAGAVLPEGPITINVTGTDTDGIVTNVQFFAGIVGATGSPTLIGDDSTAPFSFTFNPPKLGAYSYYLIRVIGRDNGGLASQKDIIVKVIPSTLRSVTTVTGGDIELREDDGGDTANGTSDNMNVRIQIATGTTNRHEAIGMRFDFGPTNTLANLSSVSLNMLAQRAVSARVLHVYGVTNGTVGLDNGTNALHGYTDNNWPETNNSFSSFPGLVWDGLPQTQGLTNAMSLGTLSVSKNEGEVWSFKSPQLLQFLQGNPDSVVTFIVECDTDNTGQERFATKEAINLATILTPPGTTNWWAPFVSFTIGAPTLTAAPSGSTIQFSWVGTFKLQVQTNNLNVGLVNSAWTDYPGGGASPVSVSVNPANPTVFYRLFGPP